jgi:hypothetical protein
MACLFAAGKGVRRRRADGAAEVPGCGSIGRGVPKFSSARVSGERPGLGKTFRKAGPAARPGSPPPPGAGVFSRSGTRCQYRLCSPEVGKNAAI